MMRFLVVRMEIRVAAVGLLGYLVQDCRNQPDFDEETVGKELMDDCSYHAHMVALESSGLSLPPMAKTGAHPYGLVFGCMCMGSLRQPSYNPS